MVINPRGADEFVREIAEVVLGLKRMLYTADLSAKYYLCLRDEGHVLQLVYEYSNDAVLAGKAVFTVRDLIQKCFALLGVEVEFCGKVENEKGVIIDYDISLLNTFGIDIDIIKLGQTIVKNDASKASLFIDRANRNILSDIEIKDDTIEECLEALLIRYLNDLRNA